MDRKTIEAQLAEYRKGEAQLRNNLLATQGAIQAMEQLLEKIDKEERKNDKADKDSKGD
jgi:hypothetical protein